MQMLVVAGQQSWEVEAALWSSDLMWAGDIKSMHEASLGSLIDGSTGEIKTRVAMGSDCSGSLRSDRTNHEAYRFV
jgi:hypothetical protein